MNVRNSRSKNLWFWNLLGCRGGGGGGPERRTADGGSSLVSMMGLSFFPLRVYSGPPPPKILHGKVRWKPEHSEQCLCTLHSVGNGLCRWRLVPPCEVWSPVHNTDGLSGGPTGGPAPSGPTWERANTINIKLFHAIKDQKDSFGFWIK